MWLRAECDFLKNIATFRSSIDGKNFNDIGQPHTMAYGLITFQGARKSLFAFNTQSGADSGYADFDSIEVSEESARPIPYGKQIELNLHDGSGKLKFGNNDSFTVTDRKLGRVALRTKDGFVSVNAKREVALSNGSPGLAETFQTGIPSNSKVFLLMNPSHLDVILTLTWHAPVSRTTNCNRSSGRAEWVSFTALSIRGPDVWSP